MKQTITKNFLLLVLALAIVFAFAMRATIFQQPAAQTAKPAEKPSPDFAAYWFAGKAELNHYKLQQAQYGVLNPGEAVLIFVTEDFRTDTQVKSESEPGSRTTSRANAVPVLKTNISRTFVTGIYDYSLFTSVFTPINNPSFPNTLKVSTSAQEWCGHSYLQVNYQNSGYRVVGKSYFEKEVNEDYVVEKAILEDELWNRIRINPDKLPTGDIRLIPGTASARLRHKTLEPLAATAKLDDYEGVLFPGKFLKSYTVQYPTDDRTLMIVFERAFPHRIVGWEETYPSKDALLTSRAVLTKTIQNDYWNHNQPADSTLRAELMK
ncbi:hypothetical protein [Spirosoma montaniterrae]|uniref:Septum formation inhibitor Maf n=1 Tax=Spirosoma montaniterrae TaxID=1178516 RepID=A0A1P9X1S7_9BACT|nr:hypothetical protein [Spirosoma montaniterrae]AQG81579.1 hypothetical protein AWR27_21065 [Spirosoma montaniterrae]